MTTEKPRKLVTVVCACIRRRGGHQVLLSMRHAPGVPSLDGKWELPGGKIEFGETPEQAVIREIREEIGLRIKPLRLLPYLHTNFWEYEHVVQHVVLACYECEQEEGSEVILSDDVRWFDIGSLDFGLTLPGTEDFVSLAFNEEWFNELFISFELIDPKINAKRYFSLGSQKTFFSQYGLIEYWGRIGHRMRSRDEFFESPREMESRLLAISKRRLSHGYKIREHAGRVQRYQVLGRIIELAQKQKAMGTSAGLQ